MLESICGLATYGKEVKRLPGRSASFLHDRKSLLTDEFHTLVKNKESTMYTITIFMFAACTCFALELIEQ